MKFMNSNGTFFTNDGYSIHANRIRDFSIILSTNDFDRGSYHLIANLINSPTKRFVLCSVSDQDYAEVLLNYYMEDLLEYKNSQNPLYCPFCKKEVSVEKEARYFFDSYYVFCGNVECPVMPKSMYFRTREEAIDAWTGNRNSEEDRP